MSLRVCSITVISFSCLSPLKKQQLVNKKFITLRVIIKKHHNLHESGEDIPLPQALNQTSALAKKQTKTILCISPLI